VDSTDGSQCFEPSSLGLHLDNSEMAQSVTSRTLEQESQIFPGHDEQLYTSQPSELEAEPPFDIGSGILHVQQSHASTVASDLEAFISFGIFHNVVLDSFVNNLPQGLDIVSSFPEIEDFNRQGNMLFCPNDGMSSTTGFHSSTTTSLKSLENAILFGVDCSTGSSQVFSHFTSLEATDSSSQSPPSPRMANILSPVRQHIIQPFRQHVCSSCSRAFASDRLFR
jgi:hypothetical protein